MALITVNGFPNYKISECGQVFGHKGLLKASLDKRGYHRVWLYANGIRTEKYIHRLVAEHFIEGDKSLTVNHRDGDKDNNHIKNLEWLSNQENMIHSFKTGLRDTKKTWQTRRKINNGFTCADKEVQKSIVNAYKKGNVSMRQVARDFGVNRTTVRNIINKNIKPC